jgi:siroheme synthase-like protein
VSRSFYPLFVDLVGRRVVVVGGGSVAARKIERLLECGAVVRVIAPRIEQSIAELGETGRGAGALELIVRPFEPFDLDGALLAVAATDDPRVNARVAEICGQESIWVNVADDSAPSSVIVPAVATLGGATVAISTGGDSPAVARAIRELLEAELAAPVGEFLRIARMVRSIARETIPDEKRRRAVASSIVDGPLLAQLRQGQTSEAAKTVRRIADEFELELPDDLLRFDG